MAPLGRTFLSLFPRDGEPRLLFQHVIEPCISFYSDGEPSFYFISVEPYFLLLLLLLFLLLKKIGNARPGEGD